MEAIRETADHKLEFEEIHFRKELVSPIPIERKSEEVIESSNLAKSLRDKVESAPPCVPHSYFVLTILWLTFTRVLFIKVVWSLRGR